MLLCHHGKALIAMQDAQTKTPLTEAAISLYLRFAGGCIGPVRRPRSPRHMSSWGSYQVNTVTSDGSSPSSASASTGYFGGAGGPSLPRLVAFTLATIGVAFTLGEQRQGHHCTLTSGCVPLCGSLLWQQPSWNGKRPEL